MEERLMKSRTLCKVFFFFETKEALEVSGGERCFFDTL